jgi:hypothetical protein
MRTVRGLFTALPLAALLLAGCTGTTPSYREPAPTNTNAATVSVSVPSEQYAVSQNKSWIQIAAVDGKATGRVQSLRVVPGKHKFTIRHHDPYATIYGNIRYADIEFDAAPGGSYRIDGSYCCGFYLGQFELAAIDEHSGQQIARTLRDSKVRLTGP